MVAAVKGYRLISPCPKGCPWKGETSSSIWRGTHPHTERGECWCSGKGRDLQKNPVTSCHYSSRTQQTLMPTERPLQWKSFIPGSVRMHLLPRGTGGTITGIGESLGKGVLMSDRAVEPADLLSFRAATGLQNRRHRAGFIRVLNTKIYDEIIPADEGSMETTRQLALRRESLQASLRCGHVAAMKVRTARERQKGCGDLPDRRRSEHRLFTPET